MPLLRRGIGLYTWGVLEECIGAGIPLLRPHTKDSVDPVELRIGAGMPLSRPDAQ